MKRLGLMVVLVVGGVSCDEESDTRTQCSVFLECYLDCRGRLGAFDDGAQPTINGINPDQAHTMCWKECSDAYGIPLVLEPDDLNPLPKQEELFFHLWACISE